MQLIPGILAVLILSLGQAAPADVILLKDGTKRTGVIVEETEEAVILQITVKGPKGEVTGKQRIERDQIAEIRRMPAEARPSAGAPGEAREQRRARIVLSTATIGGSGWLLATGDRVEVQTTCDEEFARDVCDALEQAYAGCLRRFTPRRPATGRQRVILLPGRAEYDAYLKRTYGATVLDPAIYRAEDNVLVACDCIEKDEAARMRGLVQEKRKQVDDVRRKTAEAEERHRAMVRGTRQEILDSARKEKDQLRREGKATPEALREVDRQAKAAIGLAESLAKVLHDQDDERPKAAATIRECEEVIRKNELLLKSQNRVMFERLFHESFHAFAHNRLRTDREIPRWLEEGAAACFETAVVEGGDLSYGAAHADLLKLYRDEARDGRLPKLGSVLRGDGKLLVVRHEGRLERPGGAYAVSWALAHYLGSCMTLEQMDGYLADLASGADAADALAKRLGQPLGKIDEAVRAHVAVLK